MLGPVKESALDCIELLILSQSNSAVLHVQVWNQGLEDAAEFQV